MDALITTILAGVVLAVIGAFAAYYFGVRQERLKQAYDREKEAHRRQEEKRRKRQVQEAQEVVEAIQKMRFMESQGVDLQVTPDGKVTGFVSGDEPLDAVFERSDAVRVYYNDLHQLHKSERERGIILEVWERFQEEEG